MRKKKTFIHVNQHVIRANMKHKKNDPVITVKSGKENTYCHEVEILGNSKVIYGGNDNHYLVVAPELLLKLRVMLE